MVIAPFNAEATRTESWKGAFPFLHVRSAGRLNMHGFFKDDLGVHDGLHPENPLLMVA